MVDYAALLKKGGLKATFQRINILEAIDKHGHMSIDEIYHADVKTYPSLSLATVYKNIILMAHKGVLVEVPIMGKKPKFELTKKDHIHLICTQCGEVEDRPPLEETKKLLISMTSQEHFSLKRKQINLYGICAQCQAAKAS